MTTFPSFYSSYFSSPPLPLPQPPPPSPSSTSSSFSTANTPSFYPPHYHPQYYYEPYSSCRQYRKRRTTWPSTPPAAKRKATEALVCSNLSKLSLHDNDHGQQALVLRPTPSVLPRLSPPTVWRHSPFPPSSLHLPPKYENRLVLYKTPAPPILEEDPDVLDASPWIVELDENDVKAMEIDEPQPEVN